MSILMPSLAEGRIYRRTEVESYIGTQAGTSDFDVVKQHFPLNLATEEHDRRGWRDGEEPVLQYHVFPMADLKQQIWQLDGTFCPHDDHRKRVEAIVERISSGDRVFPVFMQQNDPQHRIIEGMHRAVALLYMGSHGLPTFLVGYFNWFEPDRTIDGFEREDEIVSASSKEVLAFFLHATCIDHKGMDLALLDGDRLRLCDEALVAKHGGRIVGAATLTIAKGSPTLSTIYVLRQFRQKGVAYRLCEKALIRCTEAGVHKVFCDVQSIGMEATLNRLGRDRPDLRSLVNAHIGYRPGEDIEMDLGNERKDSVT